MNDVVTETVTVGDVRRFKMAKGRGRPRVGTVIAIDGETVTLVDRLEQEFTTVVSLVGGINKLVPYKRMARKDDDGIC